jgi:hypothetical protein
MRFKGDVFPLWHKTHGAPPTEREFWVRFSSSSRSLLLLALFASMMTLLLIVGASDRITSASATSRIEGTSPIEGIWSFNGGKVAIQPGPEGTFVGTVVAPTKFALCTHPIGEKMWTDITLQSNGSYDGLHQWWFYETTDCVRNPTPGLTAWRVMEAAGGGHYLLVCFSSPEASSQPIIAPNGKAASDNYGCVESGHIAPLPGAGPGPHAGTESFSDAVSLPGNMRCLSRRIFQIHLKDPKYDPLKEVVVTLGRHRITVKRHGNAFVATINLKGLPRGTFTVRIRVTTVLGYRLTGSRTYHTCATKPKSGKPKPLKSIGRRHR